MKNFLKTIVVALALLGLTSARAAKKVEVTVDQNLHIVHVALKSVSVGESLVIKDFKGFSLYKKTFREMSNFQKSFSLKGKDHGMYFVEVENDTQMQITPVLKNDLGVTLIERAAKFMFKPQFSQVDNVFKFSLINSNEDDIKIAIYTESGILITSEEMVHDVIIKRNYNTKELEKGVYTLLITQGKKTFSKNFDVN